MFDLLINMVFNVVTSHETVTEMKNEAETINADRKLIEGLGGPTKLAEILGYDKHGGVQRIQNWLSRGIPPKVKLQHPEIFLAQPRKPAPPALDPRDDPDRPYRNPPNADKLMSFGG